MDREPEPVRCAAVQLESDSDLLQPPFMDRDRAFQGSADMVAVRRISKTAPDKVAHAVTAYRVKRLRILSVQLLVHCATAVQQSLEIARDGILHLFRRDLAQCISLIQSPGIVIGKTVQKGRSIFRFRGKHVIHKIINLPNPAALRDLTYRRSSSTSGPESLSRYETEWLARLETRYMRNGHDSLPTDGSSPPKCTSRLINRPACQSNAEAQESNGFCSLVLCETPHLRIASALLAVDALNGVSPFDRRVLQRENFGRQTFFLYGRRY